MPERNITLITFFVTMLLIVNVEAQAHSFTLFISPAMAIKKSSAATTKAQAGLSAGTKVSYTFYNDYFLQLKGGFTTFRPSGGGSDWIIYRGFNAWDIAFGGGYRFPAIRLFGEVEAVPVLAMRCGGNFAKYHYTEIHFFYPGLEIEPSLEAFSFNNDQLHWRLGIPIAWNFQRDLDLFVTAGISVDLLYSYGGE